MKKWLFLSLIVILGYTATAQNTDSLAKLDRAWTMNHMRSLDAIKCSQEYSLDVANDSIEKAATICSLMFNFFEDSSLWSNNRIFIDKRIGLFTEAKELETHGNVFIGFSPEIKKLKQLRLLWIETNIDKKSIPKQLKECDSLQAISLDGVNKLNHLPKGVLGLKNLKFFTINMEGINSPQVIDDIVRLSKSKNIICITLCNFHPNETLETRLLGTNKIVIQNFDVIEEEK